MSFYYPDVQSEFLGYFDNCDERHDVGLTHNVNCHDNGVISSMEGIKKSHAKYCSQLCQKFSINIGIDHTDFCEVSSNKIMFTIMTELL